MGIYRARRHLFALAEARPVTDATRDRKKNNQKRNAPKRARHNSLKIVSKPSKSLEDHFAPTLVRVLVPRESRASPAPRRPEATYMPPLHFRHTYVHGAHTFAQHDCTLCPYPFHRPAGVVSAP